MNFSDLNEKAKQVALDSYRYEFTDHFDVRDEIDYLNDVLSAEYDLTIYEISEYDLYERTLTVEFSIGGGFLEKNRRAYSFSREGYLIFNKSFFSYTAKWWNNNIGGELKLDCPRCVYCDGSSLYCDCETKGFITSDNDLEMMLEEFKGDLKSVFSDACSTIFRHIKESYEYYSSDDYVGDVLINNDYEFNEDGSLGSEGDY